MVSRPVAAQAPLLAWILTGAAILAQIAYPLTDGTARDAVTVAIVVLVAAACLTHAGRRAPALLVITAGLGLAAEIIGTATGFPFGCYEYAQGRLGPALADVPLVVPLAWTAGFYQAAVVASLLCRSAPARVLVTAVGVVGWDLYIDPQMVADGQWIWCGGVIPFTNYLGWFVVGLVMAVAAEVVCPVRRPDRPLSVPVVLFVWTWLGSALAHLVFLDGLERSALYGFVGMGLLGVPLLRHFRVRGRDAAR